MIGTGARLEDLIRQIVREEIARLIGVQPDDIEADDELRRRVAERAARMRAARGGAR